MSPANNYLLIMVTNPNAIYFLTLLKGLNVADITMCKGEGCKKKDKCLRHTAKANEYRQSYFVILPINKKNNKCEYFWKKESVK